MDQTLVNLLAPSIALSVSLVTFVATQRRAARAEDRTAELDLQKAAKDTVDLLVAQNRVLKDEHSRLQREHTALLARFEVMERKHEECQRTLLEMTHRVEVMQATQQARVQVVVQPNQLPVVLPPPSDGEPE